MYPNYLTEVSTHFNKDMGDCSKITSPKKKFSDFLLLTVPPFGMFGSGQRSKPLEVEKMVTATKEARSRWWEDMLAKWEWECFLRWFGPTSQPGLSGSLWEKFVEGLQLLGDVLSFEAWAGLVPLVRSRKSSEDGQRRLELLSCSLDSNILSPAHQPPWGLPHW